MFRVFIADLRSFLTRNVRSKVPFSSHCPPCPFAKTPASQQSYIYWIASVFTLHKVCANKQKYNINNEMGESSNAGG